MKKLKLVLLLSVAIVAAVFIFNIGDARRYAVGDVRGRGCSGVPGAAHRGGNAGRSAAAQGVAGRGRHRHGRHPGRRRLCGRAQHARAGHRPRRAHRVREVLGRHNARYSRGPVRIHAGAERARARRRDERRAIDQPRCAARRIHCRMGGRSARRDQPASVAHALERFCEARRLALARDACGKLCAERRSASGAARLATRCGAQAGRIAGRAQCRHSRAGAREQARTAVRQTTGRTHLAADRRRRILAGARRRARAAAFAPGSATGCASARCWPTTGCSKATN